MGNSNSSTKPKPYVLGSVNGFNHYYNQQMYMPESYVYPMFEPVNYPVVSNVNYLNKQYYPTSKPKTEKKVSLPPGDHEHGHHHHHHSHHGHHHHHHQHEPIIMAEHGTSPPPLTIFAEKKPIPPVTVTRIITPTVVPPPPPPPIPIVHKESIVVPLPLQRSPTVTMKVSPTPTIPNQTSGPSSALVKQPPIVIKSDIFQRAPPIETNYLAKSSDETAIHSYGSRSISIIKRSPSRYGTAGNRWYDHDYDKRVKSLVINDN